jgi:hypothetical protein
VPTCTICHQPVGSARFIDRSTGAHMHPMCVARSITGLALTPPTVAERRIETAAAPAEALKRAV